MALIFGTGCSKNLSQKGDLCCKITAIVQTLLPKFLSPREVRVEEVGRFVQTHHANFDQLIPSNIPFVQQVFLDRVGCYYVKSKWILKHQDPPLGIVNACSFLAWSHGLKVFGVRNGSECLGDKHLPSILPGLNGSKGCLGGRGGQNMSDVYRLTSRRI